MIRWQAAWAIALRHLLLYKYELNIVLMMFYWPLLDILVWGFMGTWVQQSGISQFHNYELTALLGVLLWQIAARGANAISFALCEELWQHNVINIFSLPLRMREWITGVIIYFMLTVAIVAFSSLLSIYVLYNVSLPQVLFHYLLFCVPLLFCGIWLGFTCLHVVILLGKRGVELGYVIIWFLLPFSGAYYPIDVLPLWAQRLSSCFPMSYVFTAMRDYLAHQQNPLLMLLKGTVLSSFCALFAIGIFVYLFNKSRQKGLARLTD